MKKKMFLSTLIIFAVMLSSCGLNIQEEKFVENDGTAIVDTENSKYSVGSNAQEEKFVENYGIAIVDTENSKYSALAIDKNGEQLVAITELDSSGNVTTVKGTVWYSPEGDAFTVFTGEDGFPNRIVVGDLIFLLLNYTDNSVDVAIISSDGEVEVVLTVPVDSNKLSELHMLQGQSVNLIGKHKLAKPVELDMLKFKRTLKIASLITAIAGCVATDITATVVTFEATLATLVLPCDAAIIGDIQLMTEDDGIASTSSSIGLGVVGCGSDDPLACPTLIINTTETIVSAAEDKMKDQESLLNHVENGINIVGEWTVYYRLEGYDYESSTMIIDENLKIDENPQKLTDEDVGHEIPTVYWTFLNGQFAKWFDGEGGNYTVHTEYTGVLNNEILGGTLTITITIDGEDENEILTGDWWAERK